MKRLCFVVMCAMLNLSGMHFMRRLPKKSPLCFNNVPPNFGTTHFIRGYTSKKEISPYFESKNVVSYIEPIIDGSSVHLLDESRLVQSFFPSVHNVLSIILHFLSQAKKSIYIAAFALTDNCISKELIKARQRGIDVSIIMDASNAKQPYSKGQMLADNKISVKCYDPTLRDNYKKKQFTPLMHRKCCIVDGKIVITGSTNLTRAGLGNNAEENNAEDINVIRCKDTIKEQITEYKRIDKCSTILHPR